MFTFLSQGLGSGRFDYLSLGLLYDRCSFYPLNMMGEKLEFSLWYRIVETCHLFIPNDHQFLLLIGVEPAHKNVRPYSAQKLQSTDRDIRNTLM